MLIKAHIIAIVTVALAASAVARPNRYIRWTSWVDFLCSDIWIKDDNTFETERIPEMRTFVGSYSFDVGTCPVGSCINTTYIHNFDCQEDYGYICPRTETRTADLGAFGSREYQYVTKCVCCEDEGIRVRVRTINSETGESLDKMIIKLNNRFLGYTNEEGEIESTVEATVRSLVVVAQDANAVEYLDAVKVIDIPLHFRGPVEITLHMIKKAKAVEIDSTEETKLSLSNDPSNPDAGNAYIIIEPNSFRRFWGTYKGKVKASVTFIDTNSGSENPIPGRFLTSVGENLISDGIVAFEFKDRNDRALRTSKPIRFGVRKGMRLWNLNEATGLWETIEDLSDRRKRQVTLTDEYLINVANGQWVNIDKIPGAPRCYFKARIFNETSGAEITSSTTASFKPEIIAYTNQNQRLRMYAGYTSSPSDTCFEVRCPDVSDPDDALSGFINMSSTEIVSIGGVNVPYTTYHTPRTLTDYTVPIRNRHSAVQYAIAPNDLDIFVNFVSNAAGPFYTSRNPCENSPVQQPAFHFFKPALPSYEPVPNDTDICTARIAFGDEWNFYNYTSNLTSLPNVTGISVWEENGQNYYFTDTVQLEQSANESDYFVFACLKYRCSATNEPTTVYLDIDVPNITHFYNYTNQNGDMVEHNYTSPAFYCYGDCAGPLCNSKGHPEGGNNNNVTSIEGSFVAPENVESGPDFYNSENTDCDERSSSEAFAYEFYCHSNFRGGNDGQWSTEGLS